MVASSSSLIINSFFDFLRPFGGWNSVGCRGQAFIAGPAVMVADFTNASAMFLHYRPARMACLVIYTTERFS